jgi:hypothetical protein
MRMRIKALREAFRFNPRDWTDWLGVLLIAGAIALLVVGIVLADNPFIVPTKAQQVQYIITEFDIWQKSEITQDDLNYLRLFFPRRVLAVLWEEAPVVDWSLLHGKISTSDLYRLDVFYDLSGAIEPEP